MRAIVVVLLLASSSLLAEDIYVAQNAAGADDGTSAANAKSLAWNNTLSNWDVGAGKISPGDTVHLCGLFTNTYRIGSSGTSANWITNQFESGCKFIMDVVHFWGIDGSNCNYICIDGGANGWIEWTNAGTALGNFGTRGIGFQAPTIGNIVVRNVRFTNGFVFTKGTDGSVESASIYIDNAGTNITVNNCTFHRVQKGIAMTYGLGKANGMWNLYSNVSEKCAWAMGGGDASGGSIMDGFDIHHNHHSGSSEWESPNNWYHLNSIYWWAELGGGATGSYITNLNIYANDFGPDLGNAANTTASIFLSSSGGRGIYATKIYNNVIYLDGNVQDGNVMLWRCFGASVFNNTLKSAGGTGIRTLGTTNVVITNNIFQSCDIPVYAVFYAGVGFPELGGCNYNMYSQGTADKWGDPGATWTNWRSLGFDANSTTNLTPSFLSLAGNDYRIATNSAAIAAGVNMYSFVTVDKAGSARPASAAFSLGAFEPDIGSVAMRPSVSISGRVNASVNVRIYR